MPLCPLHAMTGLNCPFCGSLRAIYSLAHGQLTTALHDNLILVAALPLMLGFWIDRLLAERGGRPERRLPGPVVAVGVVVVIAFGVIRNLPIGRALSPP